MKLFQSDLNEADTWKPSPVADNVARKSKHGKNNLYEGGSKTAAERLAATCSTILLQVQCSDSLESDAHTWVKNEQEAN